MQRSLLFLFFCFSFCEIKNLISRSDLALDTKKCGSFGERNIIKKLYYYFETKANIFSVKPC